MFFFFDNIFPLLFTLMFVLVFSVFVVTLISMLSRQIKDARSPRISVPATVVAKRTHHYHTSNSHSSSLSYYATFEFESGDRLELYMPYNAFGLIIEGDKGILTFQGKRFVDFDREVKE